MLGNNSEIELTEEDRENMAENIEQILEEWLLDFDNEEARRKEINLLMKTVMEIQYNDRLVEDPPTNFKGFSNTNIFGFKSEIGNAKVFNDQENLVSSLEAQLHERNLKIRYCEINSGK